MWKIVLAVNPACRLVAGPRKLPLPAENDPSMGLSISSGLWTRCARIPLWKVWDLFRERVESVGTEDERFSRLFLAACGCIEAGNEAEGGIGLKKGWRRDEKEFGRRIGFGGGVGGVAIQVGVERGNNTRRDERIGVESPVDAGRGKKARTDNSLGDRGSAVELRRATSVGSIRGPTSDDVEGDECGEQGDCIASNAEDGRGLRTSYRSISDCPDQIESTPYRPPSPSLVALQKRPRSATSLLKPASSFDFSGHRHSLPLLKRRSKEPAITQSEFTTKSLICGALHGEIIGCK